MDKIKAAADIIAQALPMVPFEGWNQQVLNKAAQAAGYKKTDVIRVFPGGAVDAAEAFLQSMDNAMLEELQHFHMDTMKIRERITTAVRLKLTIMDPHREAVRKTIALLALPFYCHRAMRHLYATVDAIWYAAGDKSTDFNFYSKRLILAGVYSATLLCWLDDRSQGHEQTWAFLDRRIADVMSFEKLKQTLKQKFA